MSSRVPLDAARLPPAEQQLYDDRDVRVRRRRASASRARRRRLLLLDAAIGAGLALFGLIVAPGLAVLALAALAVLGACGVSALAGRFRGRTAPRLGRRRRRGPA
jgi:hypothetical protein